MELVVVELNSGGVSELQFVDHAGNLANSMPWLKITTENRQNQRLGG